MYRRCATWSHTSANNRVSQKWSRCRPVSIIAASVIVDFGPARSVCRIFATAARTKDRWRKLFNDCVVCVWPRHQTSCARSIAAAAELIVLVASSEAALFMSIAMILSNSSVVGSTNNQSEASNVSVSSPSSSSPPASSSSSAEATDRGVAAPPQLTAVHAMFASSDTLNMFMFLPPAFFSTASRKLGGRQSSFPSPQLRFASSCEPKPLKPSANTRSAVSRRTGLRSFWNVLRVSTRSTSLSSPVRTEEDPCPFRRSTAPPAPPAEETNFAIECTT